MTPPESNVDAWISAQETFFAAQREPARPEEDERPAREEWPVQAIVMREEPEGDFWQEWFGLWG